jgi:tetratricopeptide repeat protein 21B
VLGEALRLVERARKLAPEVALYVAEQGYQQSLAGEHAAAIHTYRLAAQLDEANTSAMFGTVYCQLMSGDLAEAAQQVDFLNEVGVDKSAELVFLTALTVWRRESDRERSCFLLDQVCAWGLAHAATRSSTRCLPFPRLGPIEQL